MGRTSGMKWEIKNSYIGWGNLLKIQYIKGTCVDYGIILK